MDSVRFVIEPHGEINIHDKDEGRYDVLEKHSRYGVRIVAKNLTHDQAEIVLDYMNDLLPRIYKCNSAPEGRN